MWREMLALWKDDQGAVNTVEIVGYAVIIGGAAALVGYALSGGMRGLAGSVIKTIKNAAPSP